MQPRPRLEFRPVGNVGRPEVEVPTWTICSKHWPRTSTRAVFASGIGGFIFCNEAFARILGRHTDEVVGAEFTEVIAPEDLDMVADRYRRRWAGEQVLPEYESTLERDGETSRAGAVFPG